MIAKKSVKATPAKKAFATAKTEAKYPLKKAIPPMNRVKTAPTLRRSTGKKTSTAHPPMARPPIARPSMPAFPVKNAKVRSLQLQRRPLTAQPRVSPIMKKAYKSLVK